MKKIVYFSTAALLLVFAPCISNAQQSSEQSPAEIFCSNLSTESGNAIRAIEKMAKSNKLSVAEKQALIEMSKNISSTKTVESICSRPQA